MKHGVRLPKDKRDEMAKIALGVRQVCGSQNEANRIIAGMFRVSTTTARNLISRGKFLEVNKAA